MVIFSRVTEFPEGICTCVYVPKSSPSRVIQIQRDNQKLEDFEILHELQSHGF
jgi:hypothetical protein